MTYPADLNRTVDDPRSAFDQSLAWLEQCDAGLRIAATAFGSQQAMLVTDANKRILQVRRTWRT